MWQIHARSRRHIVHDPQTEWQKWPQGSFVTADAERFQAAVSASRNCCVWIEDASATINRDRSLSWLFTRIRHNGHMLYVLCHSATDLLPGMRNCLTEVFLFRQTDESAAWWAKTFMEKGLLRRNISRRKATNFYTTSRGSR